MVRSADGRIRTAEEIRVGDRIPGLVTAVAPVVRHGLYAPVTRAGHLVVSGACVSSYVALWEGPSPPLQHWATHAGMSVFRLTNPVVVEERNIRCGNWVCDTIYSTLGVHWIGPNDK